MNNLGLSSNGNPFQLVPPSQRNHVVQNYKIKPSGNKSKPYGNLKLKQNDPLQAFLDGDVKKLERSFQSKQFVAQQNKPQSKDIVELQELINQLKKDKSSRDSNKEKTEMEKKTDDFMNNIKNNIQNGSTPVPRIATRNQNEWTNIFKNVCLDRLKKFFIDLKSIINKQSVFNNTNLCFINQEQMKNLVQHVKRSKEAPNYPIMSLRMYLTKYTSNPFSLKDSSDLEKLINTIELFGPPDHVLISLGAEEIKLLNGNKELKYWPYGDEGITWIN